MSSQTPTTKPMSTPLSHRRAVLAICASFMTLNDVHAFQSHLTVSHIVSQSASFPKQPSSLPSSSVDADVEVNSTIAPSSPSPLPPLDPATCQQFTVTVCGSTSCNKRRADLGLDAYHTLDVIYGAAVDAGVASGPGSIIVEEGGCQGGRNCKLGPCVSVQHEDYEGSVSLEGMKDQEFQSSVFHNVVTQSDVDRVWSSVENAVRQMAEEEEEEESDVDGVEDGYCVEMDDDRPLPPGAC